MGNEMTVFTVNWGILVSGDNYYQKQMSLFLNKQHSIAQAYSQNKNHHQHHRVQTADCSSKLFSGKKAEIMAPPVIKIVVILLVCIASSSQAVSVERRKRGDICLRKVACSVDRPVCSSSLNNNDHKVTCQLCSKGRRGIQVVSATRQE